MTRVRAGRLRHRVTIEQPGPIDVDSDGAQHETWVPVFDRMVSAEITALSGREFIAAQAVQSKVATRIKVRYRPEYSATMRVTHRNTRYNIVAVLPDPDSGIGYQTLLCESGVVVYVDDVDAIDAVVVGGLMLGSYSLMLNSDYLVLT